MRSFTWLIFLVTLVASVVSLNEDFIRKLEIGIQRAKERIAEISKRWDIPNYPKFLKTCSMHKASLEILKWKFQSKILSAFINNKKEKFVVSFTGSSVTAGHDSYFNLTTTPEVGRLMESPLAMMDVEFESRNVALGNNPCVPYDVCVKYFAGEDADMVHWEQNYFCGGDPLEYFIRQAMTIPTRPVVVFSTSSTGHWEADSCVRGPHKVTDSEKALLNADLTKLVTELNKDMYHSQWGDLIAKDKHYRGAAIQAFTHHGHEDYACLGPYIRNWMEGAASWHPSVIAHNLRASHHSYFWLSIWVIALQDLQKVATYRAVDAMMKDVTSHLSSNYPPMPPAMSAGPFIDNTTCFTDYEPRTMRDSSLKAKVVQGLSEEGAEGWTFDIYENLVDVNLVKRSHQNGYLDFKWLLYSKDNTLPLSLDLEIKRVGPVMICQTPGIWGKLPDGFVNLWDGAADFYVTFNVANKKEFTFNRSQAKLLKIYYHQQQLDLCVQLYLRDESKSFPVGNHVLTVVPNEKKSVIVAWLLTP